MAEKIDTTTETGAAEAPFIICTIWSRSTRSQTSSCGAAGARPVVQSGELLGMLAPAAAGRVR